MGLRTTSDVLKAATLVRRFGAEQRQALEQVLAFHRAWKRRGARPEEIDELLRLSKSNMLRGCEVCEGISVVWRAMGAGFYTGELVEVTERWPTAKGLLEDRLDAWVAPVEIGVGWAVTMSAGLGGVMKDAHLVRVSRELELCGRRAVGRLAGEVQRTGLTSKAAIRLAEMVAIYHRGLYFAQEGMWRAVADPVAGNVFE